MLCVYLITLMFRLWFGVLLFNLVIARLFVDCLILFLLLFVYVVCLLFYCCGLLV